MAKNNKHIASSNIDITLPIEQNWFSGSFMLEPDYRNSYKNKDSSCDNTM